MNVWLNHFCHLILAKKSSEWVEAWKQKKRLKNKEKCKRYYERKKQEKPFIRNSQLKVQSNTPEAIRKRKERTKKEIKRLKETEKKRRYRLKKKERTPVVSVTDLENSFSNRMEKSRAVKKLKLALPTTPKKRVAILASVLENKKSPTVKSLEKLKVVVSPEERDNLQLGSAVMEDIKNVVEQAKHCRSDSAQTALSVIAASTSGSNFQQQHKKTLLARKLGLPLKRLSKGKRVRTQIFTSEKSCWTYIERKTRKDSISDDIKKTAYDFWIDSNNARPSGNKNDVMRVRIGPKQYSKHPAYILDKSQTEVYTDFCFQFPNIKMSQRTFERLKPYFVRAVRPKDRITCCCRYHVEARSLFNKTMEFRKKHTFPRMLDGDEELYPIYEHLTDITNATLCDKDRTNNCYFKSCLDRSCDKCGICLLKFAPIELDMSDSAPNVTWERYEYVTVGSKKKLTLVRKCTKPGVMFEYFKNILGHFAGHQYRAQWQNAQLKSLKDNLPQNHCIIIHDYSENYGCKEKVELQQSYFQRTEVSIHVSVIHRHAVLEIDGAESLPEIPYIITEHFFVISPDEKHDQFFTKTVQNLVKEYLESINYNIETIHEFTDGCPVQYKSRNCFGMFTNMCYECDCDIIRNYFETSHAKGPQDAAGGYLKNQVDLAVYRGTATIQCAADFFKYCELKLKDTKSTYCKRRIFRYIENIERNDKTFKPIRGIRNLHQVASSKSLNGKLKVRYLSCYTCQHCLIGDYLNCCNKSIGDNEIVLAMPENRQTNVAEVETEEDSYSVSDLIADGSVLAVYTDEPDFEYYLFKASGSPENLKKGTTDDWGIRYKKGSNVVKGRYFDKTEKPLTYKLLSQKLSIVPVASVIYVFSNLSCSRGILTLPETTHLDILAVLDEMEDTQ